MYVTFTSGNSLLHPEAYIVSPKGHERLRRRRKV